jgi:transcriptional regulator with XRE-family HTH domain
LSSEALARLSGIDTLSNGADRALGEQIRRLRKARGRSQQEVALRANLSIGLVSQIERGLSSASVRVLARLADALDVGIGELFAATGSQDDGEPRIVARANERKLIDMKATGAVKHLLTPFTLSPRLDIFLVELAPGGKSGDEDYVHEGEEAGLVLEGGLELFVDSRRYVLGAGDSFRFESRRPHRFANAGHQPTKAIWVNFRDDKS